MPSRAVPSECVLRSPDTAVLAAVWSNESGRSWILSRVVAKSTPQNPNARDRLNAQGWCLVERRILYDDHGPTCFLGTELTSHRARAIGWVPDQNDWIDLAAKKRGVCDKLEPWINYAKFRTELSIVMGFGYVLVHEERSAHARRRSKRMGGSRETDFFRTGATTRGAPIPVDAHAPRAMSSM